MSTMINAKLCDERHAKLAEEFKVFQEHCDKRHNESETQTIRLHERLDSARDSLDELKDSMHKCFHGLKNWFIVVMASIILSLIGTVVTLGYQSLVKKDEIYNINENFRKNNLLLQSLLKRENDNKK